MLGLVQESWMNSWLTTSLPPPRKQEERKGWLQLSMIRLCPLPPVPNWGLGNSEGVMKTMEFMIHFFWINNQGWTTSSSHNSIFLWMFDMMDVFLYKIVNKHSQRQASTWRREVKGSKYAKWVILRLIFKCILKPASILCVRKRRMMKHKLASHFVCCNTIKFDPIYII